VYHLLSNNKLKKLGAEKERHKFIKENFNG